MKIAWILLLSVASMAAADKKVIFPPGVKPVGPYSPGIVAGDFLYVSGQGARTPDGQLPDSFEGQLKQCLENIKTIVEAAGLTMDHVAYTQIYLKDISNYDKMNPVLEQYFSKNPPARSTLGVYDLPRTPVEINAIVARDLSRKKAIVPQGYKSVGPLVPGVMVGDVLFISGFLGRNPQTGEIPGDPGAQVEYSLDRFHSVLEAAGMDYKNLAFVNPYLTDKIPMRVMNKIYASKMEFGNTPARATIRVNSLPHGANMEFTGVAVKDLSKRQAVRPKNMRPSPTASPCVFAGNLFFCSAKSGFIPGMNGGVYAESVENQVRQSMRNLLDGLEEAGLDFSNVVMSNVYLDNMDDFSKMNGVYGSYFKEAPPTRTTVSQIPPGERKQDSRGHWPELEQISIIAVR